MKQYSFLFSFLFIVNGAIGQTQTKLCTTCKSQQIDMKPEISDDGKVVVEPFDGTYCFIFTKGIKQVFTNEIFKTIELYRKEEEETIVVLSPYAKVKILSKRKIKSSEFVPFAKSYVFEN